MRTSTRRALLGTITALGLTISGVSSTGVFAPVTDQALTGTATKERVETGVFATATSTVDLKLARNLDGDCGDFVDDLTTAIFSVSDITDSWFEQTRWLCVKNVGATPARLGIRILAGSVVFTDLVCSPGETDVDAQGCTADRLSNNVSWDIAIRPVGLTCPEFDQGPLVTLLGGAGERTTTASLRPNVDCQYAITVKSIGGAAVPSLTAADQTDSLQWQFQLFAL